MFDLVEKRIVNSSKGFEILISLLFLVYKLRRENTQPENMCDIVFENVTGRDGTVNRTSVYAEAAARCAL